MDGKTWNLWYDSFRIIIVKNMNRRHKMHKGEIIFHILIPMVLLGITAAMGYYVIVLVKTILIH